jgi:hypothetical protein
MEDILIFKLNKKTILKNNIEVIVIIIIDVPTVKYE